MESYVFVGRVFPERAYVSLPSMLRRFATPRRHGEIMVAKGNERVEMMKMAWRVVDRYCIYLKNKEPLDEKYEILKCPLD